MRLARVDRLRARHLPIARAAAPGVVGDPPRDGVLIARRLREVRVDGPRMLGARGGLAACERWFTVSVGPPPSGVRLVRGAATLVGRATVSADLRLLAPGL